MDILINFADEHLGLDWVYANTYPLERDNIYRQGLTLFHLFWIGGMIAYLGMASISYVLFFDRSRLTHPRFLKDQIKQEIAVAMRSIPVVAIYTLPWFLLEVRGYSKLYEDPFQYGKFYFFFQFVLFLAFTDGLIYYIHRGLHYPFFYKHLHKTHHKWIAATPFASHSFAPLDGYAQSLPYHFFPFLFPIQKHAYVALFMFVNVWTVLIHDGAYFANNRVINGAACHTLHHLYFNYNYGQFTTFWDRLGGSYRAPTEEEFYRKADTYDKDTVSKRKCA